MNVLVVEADPDLGQLWCQHLNRQGGKTTLVTTAATAFEAVESDTFDALVLDLMFPGTSVTAIADLAVFRQPNIAVIVVTANSFFSDGSIFKLIPNVRGFLHSPVQAEDLAALVDHYGRAKPRRSA